jgi:MFS superfamily sulfate permease-like transporter
MKEVILTLMLTIIAGIIVGCLITIANTSVKILEYLKQILESKPMRELTEEEIKTLMNTKYNWDFNKTK